MTDPTPHVTPRVSDDQLDDLDVHVGLARLLDGLLDSPAGRALSTPDDVDPRRSRWPVLLGSAAAVVLVAATSAVVAGHGGDARPGGAPVTGAVPAASRSTTSPPVLPTRAASTPPTPPSPRPPAETGPSSYAVLDAPGWHVETDSVTTAPGYGVEVTWIDGSQRLELSWTVTRYYASQVADAGVDGGTAGTVDVLGVPAPLFAYDDGQVDAYRPVRDGYGLKVAGSSMDQATYRSLLEHLRVVDVEAFEAALPASTVTPADSATVVEALERGTQAPTGYRPPTVPGINARYQVGAPVVTLLGCAWLRQWTSADPDDDAARSEAVAALAGAHDWPVLTDVLRQPDWFAATVQLMRQDAPDAEVLGSQGCHVPAAAYGPTGAPSVPPVTG